MTDEATIPIPLPMADGSSVSVQSGKEEGSEKESTDSRIYEIGYLIVAGVVEHDVPREVTYLKDMLEKEGAVVISEEFPKFKPLAYPMKKHIAGAYQTFTNAYFGWIKFELQGEKIKRIETALKQNPNLLRFLLVKTVREHTIVGARPPKTDGPRPKREAPTTAVASAPVSEAELDKSIEKLIAE